MKKQKGVLISVNNKDLKLLKDDTSFKNIKKKIFWKNVIAIGSNAFSNCTDLKTLELPDNIRRIDEKAFLKSHINQIKLNEGLKEIGKNAFSECKNLKEIEIPSSIHTISEDCFFASEIEKVKLNEGTSLIGSYAFSECDKLKTILIPSSIITINNSAFENSGLEDICFDNKDGLLTNIEEKAFYNCKNLKSIEIPGSVEIIGKNVFGNSGLENIKLNEGIKKIDYCAFSECKDLKKIEMPNSITRVQERAFYNSALEKIKLSENIGIIETFCFAYCKNLKEIKIPASTYVVEEGAFMNSGLRKVEFNDNMCDINKYAFYNCKDLENIILSNNVEKIKYKAFANTGLKSVTLNDGLKVIGEGTFENCTKLKQIEIPSSVKEIGNNAFKNCNFNYLYKIENGNWILSENKIYIKDVNNEYNLNELDDFYTSILTMKNYKKIFDKLCKFKKNNIIVTNECINNSILFNALFLKENTDFYKKLFKKMNFDKEEKSEILSFTKFLYSLGAFEDDKITRQKACNFIENEIDKGTLNKKKISDIFSESILVDYKKEWADFLLDKKNFCELINDENEHFISDIYNNFDEIKEFNRSNKGSQRYLRITVNVCERFFKFGNFAGVNETNEDIAMLLKSFTRKQESFDAASEIRTKYLKLKKENKISDNILKENLKEKDVFESIENIKERITSDTKETLNQLNELSNKKFTYEFLSKYDPKNFVLGKYCSCCAHIEAAGYGVMKASIISQNCQNLVIKDKSGNIIAKSTLYVNRKQGYGVFNNVEINENIISKEDKEMIYKKYKQAIYDFVQRYNEENEIKLTQINVGMGRNDLEDIIESNDKEGKILKVINFASYASGNSIGAIYEGDWFSKQYIMWKKSK